MSFTQNLKSAAWTELEVGAVVIGAAVSAKYLHGSKLRFLKWDGDWDGDRHGAPIYVKHFGLVKALAAGYASNKIKNPWAKLILMGVMVQGTVEEFNVLRANKGPDKQIHIGTHESELDAKLKALAEQNRMGYSSQGNIYQSEVAGSEHDSSIADGSDNQGNKYQTQIAGYDEMGEPILAPFSTMADYSSQGA